MDYTAQITSPSLNGEARLVVDDHGIVLSSANTTLSIPFVEVNSISLEDYSVEVLADKGDFRFDYLGLQCEPFYHELTKAYNAAVLRALFIKRAPLVTSKGEYSYFEQGQQSVGSAPFFVYDDCAVVLPTNLGARRIPLCFVTEAIKVEYALTLPLDTGESYHFARLGFDTEAIERAVLKQISWLREQTLSSIHELDPSVSTDAALAIAGLMPKGLAAPLGELSALSSSFVAALIERIEQTRAAESLAALREICDANSICVGFIKNEVSDEAAGEDGAGRDEEKAAGEDGTAAAAAAAVIAAEQGPYSFYLVAPSPDGQKAVVEFSDANTATFAYRTGGDYPVFVKQLNRALEAIDFKREVIRLSDDELRKPEYVDYYMASKRTAALQFIRANFESRIIHSTPEAWKRKVSEFFC